MRPGSQHWPQTRRVWRQSGLFELMMERAGVDTVVAARRGGGAAMAHARGVCLRCPSDRECQNWLEGWEGSREPPDFCPNADFFRACPRGWSG